MGQRAELQILLESITEHVYFQPPENVALEFPCIIYGAIMRIPNSLIMLHILTS
jgi:hypothetical protein